MKTSTNILNKISWLDIMGFYGWLFQSWGGTPPSVNAWETKASMPTARYWAGVATIDTKAYVVGWDGWLTVNEEWDSTTNTWSTKASPTFWRVWQAMVNYLWELYMFWGTNFSTWITTPEKYNNISNSWTNLATMVDVRWNIEACVIWDEILIPWGYNPSDNYWVVNQAYKPSTNSWTTYAPLTLGRYSHMVNTVWGEMIVSWGYNGSYMTDNSLFNKATNSWSSLAPIPVTLGVASSWVINNKIIFAWGIANGSYTNQTISYTKSTNSWATLSVMPSTRWISGKGAVISGKMAVFGGYSVGNVATNEVYTP